jgi:hypothetical protein
MAMRNSSSEHGQWQVLPVPLRSRDQGRNIIGEASSEELGRRMVFLLSRCGLLEPAVI